MAIPDSMNLVISGEDRYEIYLAPDSQGMTLRVFNQVGNDYDARFYLSPSEWRYLRKWMDEHFEGMVE